MRKLDSPHGSDARPQLDASGALIKDDYFLSSRNPVANVDQRHVEDLARELIERPELAQAREKAGYLWRVVTEYTAGPQISRLENMLAECTVNYALKGALDPDYPRIVRLLQAPGRWFGRDMPGSRWGGDNPDNAYRLAPVAHGARYVVFGQRMPGGVANVTYTLVANTATSVTLATLENRDVVTNADGSFVLTIDDQPAAGRPNHLQTQAGVKFLFVRDSMNDWARETPNALRIHRLDPPSRPPRTLAEMAQFAAYHFVDDVYLLYWFTRLNYGFPPDAMRPPRGSGGVGGLRSQMGSQGLIRLQENEAMVVTATDAGAAFRDFVLHDVWYLTIEYWQRQTSLTAGQMVADDDGRYTFVIAHEDPGVHNWLDTGGLHEIYALHRWQGLPRDESTPLPQITSRVVPLSDLARALPQGVRTLSPTERVEQLARRQRDFLVRFAED
jgi:hypothetical protein